MANWWHNIKRVKYSKNNRRFLTSIDMSEAKRLESIFNSRIKRGELKRKFKQHMTICTCGVSGCIMVSQTDI